MNKIKNCTLPAIAILAGLPAFAQAEQIAPNPNPLNSTITVDGNADNTSIFFNHGVVLINSPGTLNNSGALSNGTLDDNFGALINAVGGTLGNSGYLGNFGGLSNSGSLTDSGNLTNFGTGTLTNLGTGALVYSGLLRNEGALDNKGNLTSFDAIGTLDNYGTLTNYGTGTLTYGGYLGNNQGANLDNYGNLTSFGIYGTLVNDGNLTNYGTLSTGGLLANNAGAILTNSGALSNTGSIVGAGAYIQTGGQTVNNGSLSQASVQINGGSLSGAGTITAAEVIIGSEASVNPGNSPGTLTINGDFFSSGNLIFEIAGPGLYDVLDINGDAFFTGGIIEFSFVNFNASVGDYWDFLFADSITGWESLDFAFNGLGKGLAGSFSNIDNGGERLLITRTSSPVSEPETYAIFMGGLGLMGFFIVRRKAANSIFATSL